MSEGDLAPTQITLLEEEEEEEEDLENLDSALLVTLIPKQMCVIWGNG